MITFTKETIYTGNLDGAWEAQITANNMLYWLERDHYKDNKTKCLVGSFLGSQRVLREAAEYLDILDLSINYIYVYAFVDYKTMRPGVRVVELDRNHDVASKRDFMYEEV